MKKIPEVTLLFWVMKICATTLGETGGDLLTKPVTKNGLGFGTPGASLILFGLLAGLVLYTTLRPQPAEPATAKEAGSVPV